MVNRAGQCIGQGVSDNEICDPCIQRKGAARSVDAVHWSHGPDSPWQEEVCGARLPSWQDSSQSEMNLPVLRSSNNTENALMGDEIEYPCELAFANKALSLMGDEIEYPCELLSAKEVDIAKGRPAVFDVEVQRKGRFWSRLGIQVVVADGHEVRVQQVCERGLIPEWNAAHGAARQILPGDSITHVNSVSSNAEELNAALQDAVMGETLHLRISTPCQQATVYRRCPSPGGESNSTISGSSSPPSRTTSLGSD